MRGSISNRPTTYLEPWPTGGNLKGISPEECFISMKKHPTLIYLFIFLWYSIDCFLSLTFLRGEVRVSYRGAPTIRDSISSEGHFGRWSLPQKLWNKTNWVKDRLPTLNDTPLLLHVHKYFRVLIDLFLLFVKAVPIGMDGRSHWGDQLCPPAPTDYYLLNN